VSDGPNENGAAHSPSKSSESRPRRSRRSTRSGTTWVSANLQISHRHLSKAVLAIFALTLLVAAMMFWFERTFYPQIWLGATQAEVRYGFGTPQRVQKNGALETWVYTFSGHEEFVEFENGAATKVGCVSTGGACPSILGVNGDAFEGELFNRFGLPSGQELSDGEKIILHRDLSLSFKLKKFRVTAIIIDGPSTKISAVTYRFLVFLMP
jgi:hypothetical protein